MHINATVQAIPLPKRWSRRVRSAIIHTISLAQISLTHARSVAANSINARIRLKTEVERFRQEIDLLREEMRIKDARLGQIPAQRRPHCPPVERLAILELRAARHWSLAQTASHFLVTPLTIASWTKRLDDEGPDALVRMPIPVNTFPDFVGYLVRRLKVLCPRMGKTRIANVLCRAGLHLGPTTVRRMLRENRKAPSPARCPATARVVTARRPNGVWHADLTTVPTALGFWIPWLPQALPQRWPFCWWIAVAVDHFSRRVMGVAVVERLIRTMKTECTRRLPLISLLQPGMEAELSIWRTWYNGERPHEVLGGRTPDEIYYHRRPACHAPRFEPRTRWPRRSPCAGPRTLIRGQPGVRLQLEVSRREGREHLPVVTLKRAA